MRFTLLLFVCLTLTSKSFAVFETIQSLDPQLGASWPTALHLDDEGGIKANYLTFPSGPSALTMKRDPGAQDFTVLDEGVIGGSKIFTDPFGLWVNEKGITYSAGIGRVDGKFTWIVQKIEGTKVENIFNQNSPSGGSAFGWSIHSVGPSIVSSGSSRKDGKSHCSTILSQDAGSSFKFVDEYLPEGAGSCVLYDSIVSSNGLIVSSGRYSLSNGLFKGLVRISKDYGTTWKNIDLEGTSAVLSGKVVPFDSENILVGISSEKEGKKCTGVLKVKIEGGSVTEIFDKCGTFDTFRALAKSNNTILFGFDSNPDKTSYVYGSEDAGKTWTAFGTFTDTNTYYISGNNLGEFLIGMSRVENDKFYSVLRSYKKD